MGSHLTGRRPIRRRRQVIGRRVVEGRSPFASLRLCVMKFGGGCGTWSGVTNDLGKRGKIVDVEALATIAVDCGFKMHEAVGPGLLESVYEAVLAQTLLRRGLAVERQKPVPIRVEGL